MNYIASFIYHLCENEEDTYYILLAIFHNTEYKIMFANDLSRLKQLFSIFDRLISLMIPEVSTYLKNNSILSNYYASGWFITLFSNSYQFKEKQNPPIIIIKIWDEFIINGWTTLLKSGIVLLKMREDFLLSLKFEELLHFLINDLIKQTYYLNINYDSFVDTFDDFVLKEELISNMENEIIQEKKCKS